MENLERKNHWENIYETKELAEVSWYQPNPVTSLDLILKFTASKSSKIIDVGGGDSLLVDYLLDLGYQNITVLDISETAINRAKKRLGNRAENVKWIVSDICTFVPVDNYDCWHDRATFHFLTKNTDINQYCKTVENNLSSSGIMIIGTFSEKGPLKCSGIEIKQYSEKSMIGLFQKNFEILNCFYIDHQTPFNSIQNFIFCCFKKR